MIRQNEAWVDIPGYDGYYQCSNLGRIKSLERVVNKKNGTQTIPERILKLSKSAEENYTLKVTLCMDGVHGRYVVSRLTYCSFNKLYYDEIPEGYEVCHMNKICHDDRIENLQLKKRNESQQLIYQLKGISKKQMKQYRERTERANLVDALSSRVCSRCGVDKPASDYYQSSAAARWRCKDCSRIVNQEYYYSNKSTKNI